jgi:hypothetical protein
VTLREELDREAREANRAAAIPAPRSSWSGQTASRSPKASPAPERTSSLDGPAESRPSTVTSWCSTD